MVLDNLRPAKKRIICISDGVDTKSALNTAKGVVYRMFHQDVALDSICLRGEENAILWAMSDTLGCCEFSPFSLVNALAMCELEGVLYLSDRFKHRGSSKEVMESCNLQNPLPRPYQSCGADSHGRLCIAAA
jgi:hypothetical protein